MAQLPTIYTIQASDASQHTGRLQEILRNLKTENRIGDFTMLGPDDDLSSLSDTIKEGDLILIVLTRQIEAKIEQIENEVRTLKTRQHGLRIGEIIVDHVVYDNEFLTFPADLRPIRNSDDTDAVWSSIEHSLKDMFPISHEVNPFPWKKYLKYAAPILLIAILIWIIPKIFSGNGPVAEFSYSVEDADRGMVAECYPPCKVQFFNESQNFDSVRWEISDTAFTDKHPHLEFIQPGDIEITLTAFKNEKKNSSIKNLKIKAPPIADFEVVNNGCTAPCQVEFKNTSTEANNFRWDFGNGQTSEDREPPNIEYENATRYRVTLIAENSEGITADTAQIITIIPDDSPFADFTYTGTRGNLPQTVTLDNRSQNADSYVWQFPGGTPQASSSKNPTVTYNKYNTYPVTLTAKKNDGRSHEQIKTLMVIPPIQISPEIIEKLENNNAFRIKYFNKLNNINLNGLNNNINVLGNAGFNVIIQDSI